MAEDRQLDFYSFKKAVKSDWGCEQICLSVLEHMPGGVAVYELRGGRIAALYLNETYYKVVGFTKEQYSRYCDDITSVLYPDSAELVFKNAAESIRTGNEFCAECRGTRADGSDLWLLINARTLDFINSEHPVFLALVQDVTTHVKRKIEDTINIERYRVLEQAANAVVFEYDLKGDVMSFFYRSPDGERVSREIKEYSETSKRTAIVHPDDYAKFTGTLNKACREPSRGVIEYRTTIIDPNTYRWAKTTYSSVADDSGKIIKVLGRIEDIDDEAKERQHMIQLIETDPMTGVMNKLAITNRIQKMIEEKACAKSFFVMLDIDDFKLFNDTYGHAFGDEVLLSVSRQLNESFPDFVIGRFGGDEFVLFGRNDDEQSVCAAFENYLKKMQTITLRDVKCNIRCSIGVSWSQANDKTYSEYFDKADELLYKAKNGGKNCIFSEKLS